MFYIPSMRATPATDHHQESTMDTPYFHNHPEADGRLACGCAVEDLRDYFDRDGDRSHGGACCCYTLDQHFRCPDCHAIESDWPDNAPDLDDFISEVYHITASSDAEELVAMIVDDYGCSREEAGEALERVWLAKTGEPLQDYQKTAEQLAAEDARIDAQLAGARIPTPTCVILPLDSGGVAAIRTDTGPGAGTTQPRWYVCADPEEARRGVGATAVTSQVPASWPRIRAMGDLIRW